jgi:hypothetical protein
MMRLSRNNVTARTDAIPLCSYSHVKVGHQATVWNGGDAGRPGFRPRDDLINGRMTIK